jgi:hypothetical protein
VTTCEQRPPVNNGQPEFPTQLNWLENLVPTFDQRPPFEQRPLFWGPKGGRCTQVWLFFVISFTFQASTYLFCLTIKHIWKQLILQRPESKQIRLTFQIAKTRLLVIWLNLLLNLNGRFVITDNCRQCIFNLRKNILKIRSVFEM